MDDAAPVADALGAFRRDIDALGDAVGAASRDARRLSGDVVDLSGALGRGLGRAVAKLSLDGARASDVLRDVARALARSALGAALAPVRDGLGGAVSRGVSSLAGGLIGGVSSLLQGAVGFARGGVLQGGAPVPGAARPTTGALVRGPTYFALRGGLGLMGEAGPEAVLPLARGADGRLGVSATGGGPSAARPVQVVIQARDAESFRRSRSQIAAHLSRALDRGRRAL